MSITVEPKKWLRKDFDVDVAKIDPDRKYFTITEIMDFKLGIDELFPLCKEAKEILLFVLNNDYVELMNYLLKNPDLDLSKVMMGYFVYADDKYRLKRYNIMDHNEAFCVHKYTICYDILSRFVTERFAEKLRQQRGDNKLRDRVVQTAKDLGLS